MKPLIFAIVAVLFLGIILAPSQLSNIRLPNFFGTPAASSSTPAASDADGSAPPGPTQTATASGASPSAAPVTQPPRTNPPAPRPTTYRISGTVVSVADGLVLANVGVSIYRADDGVQVASTQTSAQGAYSVSVIANISYKVFFNAPFIFPKWYGGKDTIETANVVRVNQADVAGINGLVTKR